MRVISSLTVACGAAAVAVFAAGCSASTGEDVGAASQELGQSVNVPNPSGAYFASITANGSGCPAGSWEAGISDDGTAFTVSFSQYESVVEPGQAFSIKDCTLAIDLKTPEGFSFSVSSFHYQGYAILDQPGMSAKQTAKYYFRGNPVPASEQRTDMTGPYDSSYVFSDDIGIADLVWSPCGASRTLNAQTRLVLENNPQKTGSGYLNTTSVDGEVRTVFRFGLSWKQCGGGGGGGGALVPIHRAYNGRIGDHLLGVTQGEGAPQWGYEGVAFNLFADDGGDRAGLYRCRIGSHHFVSQDANCENQIPEGRLGFVSRNPGVGLAEIFRCQRNSDHLTTANPGECTAAGFRIEGSQGFVRQ